MVTWRVVTCAWIHGAYWRDGCARSAHQWGGFVRRGSMQRGQWARLPANSPPLFAEPWGPIVRAVVGIPAAVRSAAAARGARRALYSLLFIGLPGPGGLVFWFFVFTLRPDPPAQQVRPVRGTSRAHRCAGPQGAREPSVLGEAERRRSRAEETERAGCGASRWDGGPRLQVIPRRWRARSGVGEF